MKFRPEEVQQDCQLRPQEIQQECAVIDTKMKRLMWKLKGVEPEDIPPCSCAPYTEGMTLNGSLCDKCHGRLPVFTELDEVSEEIHEN